MNKQNLVREISNRIEGSLTQKDIELILNTFQDVIKDVVSDGEDIKLSGFLTFSKKHIDAKMGIINLGNKKGEMWNTPARDEISVKISETYKMI